VRLTKGSYKCILYRQTCECVQLKIGIELAKNGQAQVSWAQMVRDVLITAMNKGQLLPIALFAVAIVILLKLPSEEIVKLTYNILGKLSSGEMWAYLLLLVIVLAWYMHAKKMRTEYSKELDRIGQEKSKLQAKLAGKKFRSSNGGN